METCRAMRAKGRSPTSAIAPPASIGNNNFKAPDISNFHCRNEDVNRAKLIHKSIFESFPRGVTARKPGRFPAPTARRIPARGNAPGIVPRLSIRPVGAEDPCAPTGRATFVCSRHPGRCPGLASAGAFSAERCRVVSLLEKSFHEYFRARYLRVFRRWHLDDGVTRPTKSRHQTLADCTISRRTGPGVKSIQCGEFKYLLKTRECKTIRTIPKISRGDYGPNI